MTSKNATTEPRTWRVAASEAVRQIDDLIYILARDQGPLGGVDGPAVIRYLNRIRQGLTPKP